MLGFLLTLGNETPRFGSLWARVSRCNWAELTMSLRIKAVVDKFVEELKEALDADIQDRIMKEREMQSYIEEREREVAEREAAWKAELSRREAEIARQEARLKMEKENLEKEKSVLMGTASNQDNQDGALEITDMRLNLQPLRKKVTLVNVKSKLTLTSIIFSFLIL
ncbi:Tripartite motif-containing protein 5 [Cucumis melo var. makuwa]|uniref:Tripartite motif-containing protein 5 n=1 Tax=Cucumis melo var. makuwa TaxID=1194695 RepID=A0A5D3CA04_CUCMM|nr:Tripartite motif-containing protein 5 [Cucumis melo var. makuwa]TYK08132.1 Tripartite motif-containing protein 5 [Cucumis melo var. makuwa]